jgi:tetratricopeptide (TPR) repeat protein
LLFASHPQAVDQLRGRVEALLGGDGRTLHTLIPRTVEELPAHASELLVPLPDEVRALWVELWRGSGGAGWDATVGTILQQLNERRTVFERVVRRPTVLVLPASMRTRVYVIAPDLWTIRSFTADLPSPLAVTRAPTAPTTPTRPTFALPPPSPEEKEWARLIATGEYSRIDPWDGLQALEAAMKRGSLTSARRIAQQTLALLVYGAIGDDAGAMTTDDVVCLLANTDLRARKPRLFSELIYNLGEVEIQAGNWAAARALYQQGLEVVEHNSGPFIISRYLERLGYVEAECGHLTMARELFRRALDTTEDLAEPTPSSSVAVLRSVLLLQLGDVEELAGNLSAARDLLGRALELIENMANATPHNRALQQRLSLSLNRFGGVELRAGNLAAARTLFQRALEIREKLASLQPNNVLAQRNLIYAHKRFVVLGQHLGDIELQRQHVAAAWSLLDALDAQGLEEDNTRIQALRRYFEHARDRLGANEPE